MDAATKTKSVAEVLERYESYLNELVRLSLLGVAGIGYFITTFLTKPEPAVASKGVALGLTSGSKILITLSLIFFGIAAGAGLLSRFLIAESLAYHFSALKRAEKKDNDVDIESDKNIRDKRYTDSRRTMKLSAATLACGAACLAAGFVVVLYSHV